MKTKTRELLKAKIMDLLTSGNLNWTQGWINYNSAPTNSRGKKYKGVNKLLLNLECYINNYNDNRWYTFKQVKNLGYKLKDAKNKGVPVEYWYYAKFNEKTKHYDIGLSWEQYDNLSDEEKDKCKLTCKCYIVFNGDLVDGLKPIEKPKNTNVTISEKAKTIAEKMQVPIEYDGRNSAYYRPKEDKIHLPKMEQFKSTEEFNGTLLHELAHATGHEKRLNRNIKNLFGTENYALEELVAELTSVFVGAPTKLENHVAYIQSWKSAIEEDEKALFKAMKLAEESADYMEKLLEIA